MRNSFSIAMLLVSALAAAEPQNQVPVKGSIAATPMPKSLLLAPYSAQGQQTGPPVQIAVGRDGSFTADLTDGQYRISSDPPCITITELKIDQDTRKVSAATSPGGTQPDPKGGTTTKMFALSGQKIDNGFRLTFTMNNTLTGAGSGSYSTMSATKGLTSSASLSSLTGKAQMGGGIRLSSELCSQPARD